MSFQLLVKVSYASDRHWDCPQAFMVSYSDPQLIEALQQIPVQQSLASPPVKVCYPVAFSLVDQLPGNLSAALEEQNWVLTDGVVECNTWLTELEQIVLYPQTGKSAILSCHPKHTDIQIESAELPVDVILNPAFLLEKVVVG